MLFQWTAAALDVLVQGVVLKTAWRQTIAMVSSRRRRLRSD